MAILEFFKGWLPYIVVPQWQEHEWEEHGNPYDVDPMTLTWPALIFYLLISFWPITLFVLFYCYDWLTKDKENESAKDLRLRPGQTRE